jgi:hypothetical protein
VHRLTVGEVPVDGFWSVTVYNKDGYFSPNPQNAYSFNNITAQAGADRNVTIQSAAATGRCPTACRSRRAGTTRYRPQQKILDGSWIFPEAQPV